MRREAAEGAIAKRLGFVAARLRGEHLFESGFTVADAYLYVMLRWARAKALDVPAPLPAYFDRIEARQGVRAALQHEGLA